MGRLDEAIKQVLATGELPDVPFEDGVPVPVAFWQEIVFFVVRRADGSFHYLAAEPEGSDMGGPLGDDLPDRSEFGLYAEVGMSGAHAVLGFAPEGADVVQFEKAGTKASVNPRNGAFIVGVTDVSLPYADRLVAVPVGISVPVAFEDFEMPDPEPGVGLRDKVWPPPDG